MDQELKSLVEAVKTNPRLNAQYSDIVNDLLRISILTTSLVNEARGIINAIGGISPTGVEKLCNLRLQQIRGYQNTLLQRLKQCEDIIKSFDGALKLLS